MENFKKIKILFSVIILIFSQNLIAQENLNNDNNLLQFYDNELFHWSYEFWGGYTLIYQNQSSSTISGLKDSMEIALSSYDDVNKYFKSYKIKNILSHVFFWTGYVTYITSSSLLIANNPQTGYLYNQNTMLTYLGIMGGGLISSITGIILRISGNENIFDAVYLYNRKKIMEHNN